MKLPPFQLERFFARYEFSAPYLLSSSDCESLRLSDLLALADAEGRDLWEQLSLGYTESPGHPLLRAEIARLYRALNPQDVLVLTPEEGIFIAMNVLLEAGDAVVAIAPAYQSLHSIAQSLGCQVKAWPLQARAGAWELDLDALAGLITPAVKMLVVNFPHNPTGFLPDPEQYQAVLRLAERAGLWVFSDEMYRGLEYAPAVQLPAACDVVERAVSLGGMSKAYALPGLRIGWLASRAEGLIQRSLAFKDYTTICSSAPSEVLALIGLRARQAIADRNLAIIQANIQRAQEFFRAYAGRFAWIAPRAGSVAFPAWRGPGTVEQFCAALVEREGVMIVPGSLFDYPGGHFRLGLGRANFADGLSRVQRFLEQPGGLPRTD